MNESNQLAKEPPRVVKLIDSKLPDVRHALPPGTIERFIGFVNKEGPIPDQGISHYRGLDRCWTWRASHFPNGYGKIWACGRSHPAHRISFLIAGHNIPDGLFILHRCDNRGCVNPEHLFLGTQKDNMQDRRSKGRAPTGDRNGARLHPESLNPARGERHGLRLHPECIVRGEDHGGAKLKNSDVLTIKADIASGLFQREIAMKFGVSRELISRIKRNLTWRHI